MIKKNYKKAILGISICILTIFTSGCVKFETNINIERNGKAQVEDIRLIRSDAIPLAEIDISERVNDINLIKNPNLTATEIRNNGYEGIKTTYNIDDISKTDIKDADETVLPYFKTRHLCGKIIYIENNLFSTNYYIDSIVDYSTDPQTGEEDDRMLNFIESSISIKIPVKAFDNNANSIDEKEHIYKWTYDPSDPKNRIILKYKLLNIVNITIAVVLSVFILIGCFFLFFCLSKKHKQSGKNEKTISGVKICPYCGEQIEIDANTCKYCGEFLDNKGDAND